MKEKLAKIREEILKQIDASENLDKLNEVRVSALGKKGALTELLKSMKEVAPQDRPKVGQMVNEVRAEIETALETEKAKLEDRAMEARLKNEVIDVTLPAKKNSVGHRHPNTIALEEVERIFVGMGYEVVRGPDKITDYRKSAIAPEVIWSGIPVEGMVRREGTQEYFASVYPIWEEHQIRGSISIVTSLVQFEKRESEAHMTLEERVRRFERQEIQNTLLLYGRDMEGKRKAAKELGISLATLYNKIKE